MEALEVNSLACTHACPHEQNVHMVSCLGNAQILQLECSKEYCPEQKSTITANISKALNVLTKSSCIGLAEVCRDFLSGGKEEGDFVPCTSILFPLGLLKFYIDYSPFCHIANNKRVISLLNHTFGWEPKA